MYLPGRRAAEEEQEDVDGADVVLQKLLHRKTVLIVSTLKNTRPA